MRRAYQNYLGHELINRLTENVSKAEAEKSEEDSVELSEVLEKSAEKDGMSIEGPFEISDEEVNWLVEELKRRGALSEVSEIEDKAESIEDLQEEQPQTTEPHEIQQIEVEPSQVIEQIESQQEILTQLENQDLSELEAEIFRPEIEPKEAEPLTEVIEPCMEPEPEEAELVEEG